MVIDWTSLLLGAVVGALVSAPIGLWFGLFAARPRLSIIGGGGGYGGEPGVRIHCVTIGNRPGMFGIVLGETTIFGRRIFDDISYGLPIERQTARGCYASLRSADGTTYPLLWRADPDSPLVHGVDIACNESASLYLIARYPSSDEYVPFTRPEHLTKGSPRYTGNNTFKLSVTIGRAVVFREKVVVSRDFTGVLFARTGPSGNSL